MIAVERPGFAALRPNTTPVESAANLTSRPAVAAAVRGRARIQYTRMERS